uniref:RNA ligase 2 n=1 Tax=Diplonema papillatum TaxID=91374 RepID=A0A0P0IR96_9EUGL|nr:RNA ligase 2 [Diplonema papillatum]
MPLSQGAALIRSPTVTAEEKVDGSNLAVYLDASGAVTCQNRGKFVTPSSGSQWGGQLATWLESHYCELVSLLRQRYILYGEWLLARHSIRYQSLPDYFVAFDVYDRTARRFLSAKKRNAFLSQSTIPVVKPLAVGPFAEADILRLLGSPSRYGAAKVEGIYLRSDSGAWLQQRAKVVNSDFLQTIDDDGHWQKRVLEKNQLKY